MKTTKRFDRAIEKLYTAFHNGTLDELDCKHCAVGNLCNEESEWATVKIANSPSLFHHNGIQFTVFGNRNIDKRYEEMSGYSSKELGDIELYFLYGTHDTSICSPLFHNTISNRKVELGLYTKEEQKELQFKGLCAVIKYLCELDGISDVTDYTNMFKNEHMEMQLYK